MKMKERTFLWSVGHHWPNDTGWHPIKPESPVPLHCSALRTVYFIFLNISESCLYFLCFRLQSSRYNAERYFACGRLWRCRDGVHVGNVCSSKWVACSRQPQRRFRSWWMWCHLVWWIHNNFFPSKCREQIYIELWNLCTVLCNVMSDTAIHKISVTVRAHTTCSISKCNFMEGDPLHYLQFSG